MKIHSYGVKTHKNTTLTLVYYILPTHQQQMISRNNVAETVMKFHWVQVHFGAGTDSGQMYLNMLFAVHHTTGTTHHKKDHGEKENHRSLHIHSGIPWGTGRVESFLWQQEDNEPLSTGGGCVLGRVGWTPLYKRTLQYGLRVLMTWLPHVFYFTMTNIRYKNDISRPHCSKYCRFVTHCFTPFTRDNTIM